MILISSHDAKFEVVVKATRELVASPATKPKRRVGF